MSGSVENMVQDMLKDELGLNVIQNYNDNVSPGGPNISGTDSNFTPVHNSTNINLNNTNISDANVSENNSVENHPQENIDDNSNVNTQRKKCLEVEKFIEKGVETENSTTDININKEIQDKHESSTSEVEDLPSILKELTESDVKLKEILGDENETFENQFTEMEMSKLMKQKLKQFKIDPDRLRKLLTKTLEDSDYRKLVRLKWRVRGLAYKMKIADETIKKSLIKAEKMVKDKRIISKQTPSENYNENRCRKLQTNEQYRKRVRNSNAESRKRRMEDPDYRATLREKYNETRRRRKEREGSDYVESLKERDNLTRRRRKRQQDEKNKAKLRERENQRRRQRRQDQDYREYEKVKERAHRKKRMENEEYRAWCRERDNLSRRRRRMDAAYRQMERERDAKVAKLTKNQNKNKETNSNSNDSLVCIDEDHQAELNLKDTSRKRDYDSKMKKEVKDNQQGMKNMLDDEEQVDDIQSAEESTHKTSLEEQFMEIIQPLSWE